MQATENKKMLILFGVIVTTLLVILTSILALGIPAIPVCIIVLLEAGIVICLQDVPIWLHAAVVLIQIIAGAVVGSLVFMILCAVVYVVGILAFRFFRE